MISISPTLFTLLSILTILYINRSRQFIPNLVCSLSFYLPTTCYIPTKSPPPTTSVNLSRRSVSLTVRLVGAATELPNTTTTLIDFMVSFISDSFALRLVVSDWPTFVS
uniref:Uncharacterized protein n=1 Tax=Helianthus annuus TaxID=4232 RepID=A0A251SA59_HELAN